MADAGAGVRPAGAGRLVYNARIAHGGIDFPSRPCYTVNVYMYNTKELRRRVVPGELDLHRVEQRLVSDSYIMPGSHRASASFGPCGLNEELGN